jgi:hypothetical protein
MHSYDGLAMAPPKSQPSGAVVNRHLTETETSMSSISRRVDRPETTTWPSACPSHIEVIQTDNRSEFDPTFHWHVFDEGISHIYTQAGHLSGSTTRWRGATGSTARSSTGASRESPSTTPRFNDKHWEWEDNYNCHRPHGSLGLAGGPDPLRAAYIENGNRGPAPTMAVSCTLARSEGFEPPTF